MELACKLTSPEFRARKATALAEFRKCIVETKEIQNGFLYTFEGSDQMLNLLLEFIKTERQCCDFFQFHLTAGNGSRELQIALSGPEGVKEFIKKELGL